MIAIVPQMSTIDAQDDVVLLERGRGDLGDRARRQALEARRERGRPHGLPVEDGHPGFPALIFHRAPSVARVRQAGRPSLERARLVGVGAVDDDLAGRAEPAGLERRPARAVAGRVRRRASPRAPQSASTRSADARSWPSAVSEYDIRGGRCW